MRGVGLLDMFMTFTILLILVVLVAVVTLLVPATGGARFTVDLSHAELTHETALLARQITTLVTVKQDPVEERSEQEPHSILESIDRTGLKGPTDEHVLPPPPIARMGAQIEGIANLNTNSLSRSVSFGTDTPADARMIRANRPGAYTAYQLQVNEDIRIVATGQVEGGITYVLS